MKKFVVEIERQASYNKETDCYTTRASRYYEVSADSVEEAMAKAPQFKENETDKVFVYSLVKGTRKYFECANRYNFSAGRLERNTHKVFGVYFTDVTFA